MKTFIAGLLVALLVPVAALANSVTVKNKDGRTAVLRVKRTHSWMDVDVPARATVKLPGAPMTLTVNKTGSKIDAVSGDTVVIEKGKLSREGVEPEEPAEAAPAEEAEDAEEPAEAEDAEDAEEPAKAEEPVEAEDAAEAGEASVP